MIVRKGEFDVVGGLIEHAVEIGVLTRKGARIEYGGKSFFKNQLKEVIDVDQLREAIIAGAALA